MKLFGSCAAVAVLMLTLVAATRSPGTGIDGRRETAIEDQVFVLVKEFFKAADRGDSDGAVACLAKGPPTCSLYVTDLRGIPHKVAGEAGARSWVKTWRAPGPKDSGNGASQVTSNGVMGPGETKIATFELLRRLPGESPQAPERVLRYRGTAVAIQEADKHAAAGEQSPWRLCHVHLSSADLPAKK